MKRWLVGFLGVITISAAALIPSSVNASQFDLHPAPLTIKDVQSINAISSDGAYLYLVKGTGRMTIGWIENMNGKMWRVPNADQTAPLLGTVTGNDMFVFTHVAGSAPIAYAYQPLSGVITSFVNHRDPFALSMNGAIESTKGHWAAYRTNAPGGWGPGIYQWVDIDNTPVPMLAHATSLAWSPDGIHLGYFSGELTGGQGWLADYNVMNHHVKIFGNPVVLAKQPTNGAPQGWESTGNYSGAPSTALIAWSLSGQYLAALTQQQNAQAIQVYNVKTDTENAIPVLNTLFWGWTTDGQIYAINYQKIDFYQLSGSKWKLVHSVRYKGMLNRAVSTPKGLLVGIGFGPQTVYLVLPNGMMQVTHKPVNAWWFDAKNGYLYELPTGTSARVYYMQGLL